jgi:hypothetical protein
MVIVKYLEAYGFEAAPLFKFPSIYTCTCTVVRDLDVSRKNTGTFLFSFKQKQKTKPNDVNAHNYMQ